MKKSKGLPDNLTEPKKIRKDQAFKPANSRNINAYMDSVANKHKQVLCSGIRPNGVRWKCCCDEQIEDFITLLNDNGYITHYSCCGEGEKFGGYICINYPTSYTKYARLVHMFRMRFRNKYVLLESINNGCMRFEIKDLLTQEQIKDDLVLINTPQN